MMFLLVFLLLADAISGNYSNDIPTFLIKLGPFLSSNHLVASLQTVTKPIVKEYREIYSHKLLKVQYRDAKQIKSRITAANDTFMLCGDATATPPFRYFCIETSTWSIRTTRKYAPPMHEDGVCTIKLRINGKDRKGKLHTTVYKLTINIQARCTVQTKQYNDLKKFCRPKFTTLKPTISDNTVVYNIPQKDVAKTLTLSILRFSITDNKGILVLSIFCDNGLLQLPNNEKNVTIRTSNQDVLVPVKCGKGTKKITLEVIGDWNNVMMSDEQMRYYVMEDFCVRLKCFNKYYYWNYLAHTSKAAGQCVNDTIGIADNFKGCYVPLHVTATSSTTMFKYGKPVRLKCQPNDILLWKSIRWHRIRGGTESVVLGSDSYLNISSLSYYNNAVYVCKMRTFTKTGRLISVISKIRIELEDVFTGELRFLLPDLPYKQAYRNKSSPEYIQVKKGIEFDVAHSMHNHERFDNKANNPKFRIVSFSGWNASVNIRGEVSSLRSTPELRSWTYLQWMDRTMEDVQTKFEYSKLDEVRLLTRHGCMSNTEEVGDHLHKWPASAEGRTIKIACAHDKFHYAFKMCKRYPKDGYAVWHRTNLNQCHYPVVKFNMETISKVTVNKTNMLNVSSKLLEISSKFYNISSDDIAFAATTMEKFAGLIETNAEVESNIMDSIDFIMSANKTSLKQSERMHNSTNRILKLLGDFGENIASETPRIINRKHFAIGGVKTSLHDFNGLSVKVKKDNLQNVLEIYENNSPNTDDGVLASLTIPSSVLDVLLPMKKTVEIVAVTYNNDDLFITNTNQTEKSPHIINTRVLSAEIRGHPVKNLPDPVQLSFQAVNTSIYSHEKKCVYWDFDSSEWSSYGCIVQSHDGLKKSVSCACNHMTNFAVLFSTIPPEGFHGEILTYITYVGLGISFIGALFTLLTYAVFPMLRRKVPPKILMNLCIALLLMEIFFVSANKEKVSARGCKCISVVLQYFFLAVFSWSAVEGFQSFRGVVKPMNEGITNFIQKATVLGWGLPLVFTVIGAAISWDDYEGDQWCVVKGLPFYITVLAPIATVLFFNILCLIAIGVTLLTSTEKVNSKPMKVRVRFRIITGFVILFGITWMFGFLVVSNDVIVFQYLFCILSSLKGLYLFLFYCVRNKKHRWAWCKLFKCQPLKEIQRLYTRKSQMSRCNTGDVSSPMVSDNSTGTFKFSSLLSKKGSLASIARSSERLSVMSKKKNSLPKKEETERIPIAGSLPIVKNSGDSRSGSDSS